MLIASPTVQVTPAVPDEPAPSVTVTVTMPSPFVVGMP